MKIVKIFFIMSISIILLISCKNNQQITEPQTQIKNLSLSKDDKTVLNSTGKFGLNLFKIINSSEKDKNKNIFISPLSISVAFGMALNGAKGETYEEMVRVLELNGLTLEQINNSLKYLSETLSTIDPKVKFQIANSIWNRKGFAIIPAFLEENRNYYNAEVKELDFSLPDAVDIINKWVDDKTNHKIDKVLDKIDPAVVMYLINALYFKADWTHSFNEQSTVKRLFYSNPVSSVTPSQVDFMLKKHNFRYYEDNNMQAVDLPYGDSLYSMTVILPKEQNQIDQWIENFDIMEFNRIVDNLKYKDGYLWLPKFKFTYFKEISEILNGMGMKKATTAQADFSKITPGGGIFIGRVLHKTFIEVNEKGTEAAAVTVIEFRKTSTDDKTFNMDVNKPFMFVIREKSTNTILFVGKIVNPA